MNNETLRVQKKINKNIDVEVLNIRFVKKCYMEIDCVVDGKAMTVTYNNLHGYLEIVSEEFVDGDMATAIIKDAVDALIRFMW